MWIETPDRQLINLTTAEAVRVADNFEILTAHEGGRIRSVGSFLNREDANRWFDAIASGIIHGRPLLKIEPGKEP